MQPKTYIHSGLWRWLQVAFLPPGPSWRAEGAGAARICASEALKAGDLGIFTGAQASRAALAACPPLIIDVCCVRAGWTVDGGRRAAFNP